MPDSPVTDPSDVIDHFSEIEVKKPSDFIIRQIRDLISSGVLNPGDRLPSERVLADRFGVGRGHVREAIKKLEFYGILKTLPQSGTVVASLGVVALEGLIANVIGLEKDDWKSLIETRALLEIHAARLTAARASDPEIEALRHLHDQFIQQVNRGMAGLDEDMLFHLKIAELSKNTVLRSLVGLITPDILSQSSRMKTCRDGRSGQALQEHEDIMDAIGHRDPEMAEKAMRRHMTRTIELRCAVGEGG